MATTTVRQLFSKFGILDIRKVPLGTAIDEKNEGVYVISTSNNPDKHLGIIDNPVFDDNQIKLWIRKLPNFQVDNIPANPDNLKNRLAKFWFPDESILYIGKAPKRKNGNGIGNRVMEYFSTIIGDGGPHSGGQWIKTLENLNTFNVYYGICTYPETIEYKMIEFFMQNVSKETISGLYDKNLPIPFANIRFNRDKKHGLKNQRL